MKSNLIKFEPKSKFPIIMEYIGGELTKGLVIIFTNETSGMVVHSGNSNRKIGEYDTSLVSYNDGRSWKKFEGKIELENS